MDFFDGLSEPENGSLFLRPFSERKLTCGRIDTWGKIRYNTKGQRKSENQIFP